MAVLAFFGFDHLPTAGDPNLYPGCSSSDSGWTKVAGLLGGFGINSFSGTRNFHYDTGSTYTTLIVSGRFKYVQVAAVVDCIKFYDGATIQCGFSVNAAGKIIFWRGTNATILATGTTTLVDTAWYHIQCKVTINNTTGTVDIKLNDVSEISATGLNNRNSAANQVTAIRYSSSASSAFYVGDDIVVQDTSGGAPANDFLGITRVETGYATSNDAVQWTPNASTNVSRVSEVAVDDDTTYNSDSTSGHVDTFNHGALASTPTTIFGVQIVSKIRKDDVTARSARNKLKSGATTTNGASFVLTTSYQYVKDMYVLDPNTAAAWSGANANATKIGYEHV